jgi:putative ABC transport system permease protein
MKTRHSVKLGLQNLYAYKLRSLSTMLGIVFGVGAVIAMLSIGAGAEQEALRQIAFLGIKNVWVKYRKVSDDKIQEEISNQKNQGKTNVTVLLGIEDKTLEHIKTVCPNLEFAVRVRELWMDINSTVTGKKLDLRAVAVDPPYTCAAGLETDIGRFICDIDMLERKRVCVLGADARRKIFAWRNPVGENVILGGFSFRVVGVLKRRSVPKGATDVNGDIYVPFSTASACFGERHTLKESFSEVEIDGKWQNLRTSVEETAIGEIWCRLKDENHAEETAAIIRRALKLKQPDTPCDVTAPQELLAQSRRTKWLFNVVMGSIAAISLLVGGIGVMNTMLATISERTREIGLRRAIGANKWDVMKQFIVETLVLTMGGGVLGIGVGMGLAKVIPMLVPSYSTIISYYSVAIAFGVSVAIGIIFGLYPARRAAKINPITALKYDG